MKAHAMSTTPTSTGMTEKFKPPKMPVGETKGYNVCDTSLCMAKNINRSQVPVGNELYHSGVNVHSEN